MDEARTSLVEKPDIYLQRIAAKNSSISIYRERHKEAWYTYNIKYPIHNQFNRVSACRKVRVCLPISLAA